MSGETEGSGLRTISIADMERAMREVGLLPRNDEWTLIAPDGRMFKGAAKDLILILAPHHPLLKMPLSPIAWAQGTNPLNKDNER